MSIPSGTRFVGFSTSVDLSERRTAASNAESSPYTVEDLANFVGPGATGPQGVQGPAGPIGPVGPTGLNWQGSWVSGTSYVADDAVGYNGASWFCILATSGTSNPSVDTTHWALLASQGAQGIQGVQGPTGPQGAGASQTLQQTVDLGNTVTDGYSQLTLSEYGIQIIDTAQHELSLGLNGVVFRNGTLPTMELTGPTSMSSSKSITLPDASGTIALTSQLPTVAGNYANDTAAAAGGIAVGGMYHTAGVVKIRLT